MGFSSCLRWSAQTNPGTAVRQLTASPSGKTAKEGGQGEFHAQDAWAKRNGSESVPFQEIDFAIQKPAFRTDGAESGFFHFEGTWEGIPQVSDQFFGLSADRLKTGIVDKFTEG